jgi:hypothetical protein
MKYTAEMGTYAVTYIPSFIKIGSAIKKLIEWDIKTHRNHGDGINLLFFGLLSLF